MLGISIFFFNIYYAEGFVQGQSTNMISNYMAHSTKTCVDKKKMIKKHNEKQLHYYINIYQGAGQDRRVRLSAVKDWFLFVRACI